ncbi:MAG: bacteriocin-type signal sequence [Desulfovibrionaceae bacterium]
MEEKNEVKFHEEIKKMEYEPLDATEMKLIHWSWGLGVGLLAVLFIVSKFLLPGIH